MQTAPVNIWLPISHFRPTYASMRGLAKNFFFYWIRPTVSMEFAGVGKICARELAIIAGLRDDRFVLVGFKSPRTDPRPTHSALDMAKLQKVGEAREWTITIENLFNGQYEIFHGPIPITFA
jgi:hypothetical protein